MLDVAMELQLAPCLGIIMNERPHDTFSTEQLLNSLTECFLSNVDCKEFMQFWLFDSDVPVLKISLDRCQNDTRTNTTIELSYDILCPINEIKNGSCEKKQKLELTSHPNFVLTLHDINGYEIMPMILHDGETAKRYKVKFDTNLFLGNAISKGNFLIQYPNITYLEFMKWCFQNFRLHTTQKTMSEVKPLLFYIYDMFELSRRNVISMEWLIVILHWLGRVENFKAPELLTLVEFKKDCIGHDLYLYASKGNFKNGELERLVKLMCYGFSSLGYCPYHDRNVLSLYVFCPIWIRNFAGTFLEVLAGSKNSTMLKELKILQ